MIQTIPSRTTLADVDGSIGNAKNGWKWTIKKGKSKKILIRNTKRRGRRSGKYRANLEINWKTFLFWGTIALA